MLYCLAHQLCSPNFCDHPNHRPCYPCSFLLVRPLSPDLSDIAHCYLSLSWSLTWLLFCLGQRISDNLILTLGCPFLSCQLSASLVRPTWFLAPRASSLVFYASQALLYVAPWSRILTPGSVDILPLHLCPFFRSCESHEWKKCRLSCPRPTACRDFRHAVPH